MQPGPRISSSWLQGSRPPRKQTTHHRSVAILAQVLTPVWLLREPDGRVGLSTSVTISAQIMCLPCSVPPVPLVSFSNPSHGTVYVHCRILAERMCKLIDHDVICKPQKQILQLDQLIPAMTSNETVVTIKHDPEKSASTDLDELATIKHDLEKSASIDLDESAPIKHDLDKSASINDLDEPATIQHDLEKSAPIDHLNAPAMIKHDLDLDDPVTIKHGLEKSALTDHQDEPAAIQHDFEKSASIDREKPASLDLEDKNNPNPLHANRFAILADILSEEADEEEDSEEEDSEDSDAPYLRSEGGRTTSPRKEAETTPLKTAMNELSELVKRLKTDWHNQVVPD